MKERLFTLLGAALAFFVMASLMMPPPAPKEEEVSIPTTEDSGKYGLKTAWRWFNESGNRVISLRERYTALTTDARLPSTGNLLILSLPLRVQARHRELQQLHEWVTQGNHVLIMAGMSDWPEWATRSNVGTMHEVFDLFGYDIDERHPRPKPVPKKPKKQTTASTPKEKKEPPAPAKHLLHLSATFPSPITTGLNSVEAEWLDSEGRNWTLTGNEDISHSTLVLLRDKEHHGAALWQARAGDGTLWVTRFTDLFSNHRLTQPQNALLLRNLVAYATQGGGYAIFDDMHQGLSILYDPDTFFGDPRLHNTLWFMLALWLVYVMGHTNRFMPVVKRLKAPRLLEQVQVLGNFFARRLRSAAVAQRLLQYFFNEIRGYYALPVNGEPIWEVLRTRSNVDAALLDHAIRMHTRAQANKSLNLVTLSRTIRQIREQLV